MTKVKYREILTYDVLHKEYIINELSMNEIAKKYSCDVSSVHKYLRKNNIQTRKTGTRRLNLSGTKKGMLEIIKPLNDSKKQWLCKCDCGKEVNRTYNILVHSNGKSCGCLYEKNKYHTGYKGICGSRFGDIKKGARNRNIEFNVSIEYIWDLFEKQNKKCALTGIDITISETWTKFASNEWTASLDRIDSNKGYIEGNVWWIHKIVNKMKNNLDLEEFKHWCLLISKNSVYSNNRKLK